jgi:ATPase family associated with various cellular activities (AAA)/Winged helix domain, variant
VNDAGNNWAEANQRYLMARLAAVRDALGRKASQDAQEQNQPGHLTEDALASNEEGMSAPPALRVLCSTFGLSSFERDVLLLCAGMELDGGFPSLCAEAQGNAQRAYPTFGLALATLPAAHWSALLPASPLRRWRLIEVGTGDALTTSSLRIDERVLHYLAGISYLDARLGSIVEPVTMSVEMPASQGSQSERIVEIWSRARSQTEPWPVIHLSGDERTAKREISAHACGALGLQLHVMKAADVPQSAIEREVLARLWEREAALSQSALLVDCDEFENPRAIEPFLEQLRTMLLVGSREPLRLRRYPVVRVEISRPTAAERHSLWQEALGPFASQLDGHVERLVAQFDLGMDEIRNTSAQVLSCRDSEADGQIIEQIWDACRATARKKLDDLAQRIEPAAHWDDLVLPAPQKQILREIGAQVRQRSQVYERWGFASKGSRGLGISALFSGTSGTGKTMAAEVLADELRLDLYRIDLSQVVSKYIGETEKNLRRVFDTAEASGAVLLFDEADALFGKRSEVKDSHDRYANIEISYLLQRMETYRGLAILTTNLKNVLDTAFLRRIRFIVQFPFPDAANRAEIWRHVFPSQTPTENIDVTKLARLNVVGGNIRNIALQAAFLAAESGEPVRMADILHAARREYAKLEKPLADAEIRDWI